MRNGMRAKGGHGIGSRAAGAGLLAVAIALSVTGCGGESEPADAPATESAPATPDEAFTALETALRTGGPSVRIAFDVVAEGAVSVDLFGELLLGEEGEARLEAAGSFAGQPLDVVLISDGERMFGAGEEAGVPTPPALRDALAVGFTRMGILHNLARLSGGAAPDHAEGGVAEWVVVAPTEDREMLEGAPGGVAETSAVRAITVAGQPSGAFALEFDGRTPRVRRQFVSFPQGIMRVTERYRVVEFDADFGDSAFDTTPLDPAR